MEENNRNVCCFHFTFSRVKNRPGWSGKCFHQRKGMLNVTSCVLRSAAAVERDSLLKMSSHFYSIAAKVRGRPRKGILLVIFSLIMMICLLLLMTVAPLGTEWLFYWPIERVKTHSGLSLLFLWLGLLPPQCFNSFLHFCCWRIPLVCVLARSTVTRLRGNIYPKGSFDDSSLFSLWKHQSLWEEAFSRQLLDNLVILLKRSFRFLEYATNDVYVLLFCCCLWWENSSYSYRYWDVYIFHSCKSLYMALLSACWKHPNSG